MFKFSFDIEQSNELVESIHDNTEKIDPVKSAVKSASGDSSFSCDKSIVEENVKTCEELTLNKNVLDEYEKDLMEVVSEISIFECKQKNIKYLGADAMRYDCDKIIMPLGDFTNSDLERAEFKNSDLLPGIYEGGAKIWECTQDLANYILENDLDFNKKCVLDLGCGSGILGIVALDLNSENVHFQDYNKEILEMITIKNVLLNFKIESKGDDDEDVDDTEDEDGDKLCHEPDNNNNAFLTIQENIFDKCRFYAGDWSSYASENTSTNDSIRFDIILSSETLYNPRNYLKILNILKLKLKSDGYALFAAKTYYFGIGGSVREFQQLLLNDGTFESTVMWQTNENVKREILRIKFIQ